MKVKLLILIQITFALWSCNPNLDFEIRGYTQKIIVEGCIANNEFPRVYLSLNVPLSREIDSSTILDYVIRTAKVTVSDGENNTEDLTSGWGDRNSFPPYVYRGTEFKGEEGKTYYLTIVYGGYTLHSQTTIPFGTDIQQFSVSPVLDNDSMRILSMTFQVDPEKKTSYRVFTKKRKDGFYTETPILYNSEHSLSGMQTFAISPQPNTGDPSYEEGSYFAAGDTVLIKFCAIDSTSNAFFKDLSYFSSTTGVGNNYFIGEKEGLKTNITPPGFGIWWGNSVRYYQYVIR